MAGGPIEEMNRYQSKYELIEPFLTYKKEYPDFVLTGNRRRFMLKHNLHEFDSLIS